MRRFFNTVRTPQAGYALLHDPLLHKGMGHDMAERDRMNLRGLVPPRVKSQKEQVEKVIKKIREEVPVQANLYLQDLHDRNETLYHRVVVDYIEEIAPLIYTPTVGLVCQQYGLNFRRPRGMYFSRYDRGLFGTMLYNWPWDVKVIVVTDGSRILGLGDLGLHGMGIPIGKLALYCAAGGINPKEVLPVVLDVGTNNETLRTSEDYVGTPEPRLEGAEYDDFLDEFMQAVFERWPETVVQFEDFETSKAVPLLARYRHLRCFNDDIQGTGCVTLAGVLSAARNANVDIKDMRFLCAGAGSAGLGVCSAILAGLGEAGLSREEALANFVICTSKGALGNPDGKYGDPNHKRGLSDDRKPWINSSISDGTSMLDVVKQFKPTCLLGLAAQPGGLFTQEMIQAMTTPNPIIMPMSNPTDKAECTPQQAYQWSNGKAVVATGSPFDPVTLEDGTVLTPSQCNNMYVFPGIGLAASLAGTKQITDRMLYRAALACVDTMTDDEIAKGRTFPALNRIRDVSVAVATAVIDEGFRADLNTKLHKDSFPTDASLKAFVQSSMWQPDYVPLVHQP